MESIKFYYNGFKVAGSKKLAKAFYTVTPAWTMPNGTEVDDRITITARDVVGFGGSGEEGNRIREAVREIFEIENNSDSMVDYFDKDRIRVRPGDEMFSAVFEAVEKSIAKQITKAESKGQTGRVETLRKERRAARRMFGTHDEIVSRRCTVEKRPETVEKKVAAPKLTTAQDKIMKRINFQRRSVDDHGYTFPVGAERIAAAKLVEKGLARWNVADGALVFTEDGRLWADANLVGFTRKMNKAPARDETIEWIEPPLDPRCGDNTFFIIGDGFFEITKTRLGDYRLWTPTGQTIGLFGTIADAKERAEIEKARPFISEAIESRSETVENRVSSEEVPEAAEEPVEAVSDEGDVASRVEEIVLRCYAPRNPRNVRIENGGVSVVLDSGRDAFRYYLGTVAAVLREALPDCGREEAPVPAVSDEGDVASLVEDLRSELLKSEDDRRDLMRERRNLESENNLLRERADRTFLDSALRRMIREELEVEVEDETDSCSGSTYHSIRVSLRIKGDAETFAEDSVFLSID